MSNNKPKPMTEEAGKQPLRGSLGAVVRLREILKRSPDGPKTSVQPYSYAVMVVLWSHADVNGIAWPSQSTIADEASMSVSQVKRALEFLYSLGIVKRIGRGGKSRSTRYQIAPEYGLIDNRSDRTNAPRSCRATNINKKEQKPLGCDEVASPSKGSNQRFDRQKSSEPVISFEVFSEQYAGDLRNTYEFELAEYFVSKYREESGIDHPRLKVSTWKAQIRVIDEPGEDDMGREPHRDWDFNTFDMINDYFKTIFADNCDYALPHFNSGRVKEQRVYSLNDKGHPYYRDEE